jgi:hypothetical protein
MESLPAAPTQSHRFLLKLRGETSSRLAHEALPFADYAWKVSTKSGEDQIQAAQKFGGTEQFKLRIRHRFPTLSLLQKQECGAIKQLDPSFAGITSY